MLLWVKYIATHRKASADWHIAVGTDVRKVILDGWNPENIAGIDILPAYFQLGREFFKEPRPGSPNPIFLAGDLFSVDFLSINPSQATNVPALRKVKELSEMAGAAQVIHIASVFHLFEELQQVSWNPKVMMYSV